MKKLDRFLLREVLSDGPAGTVYRAEEILPGDNRRTVVLKVMPAAEGGRATGESETEQRFFGEVRVLAQLAVHPHVVTIYAMGVTDGYPWLAMENAPATLASKVGENAVEPFEIMRMIEQVALGLMAMHALKPALIHQDLKPANILIDVLGNYKITDFSLATVTAAHKTHGLATVRYAAPEMLSGEFGRVGPGTDLYALGHIAYELALGSRLHRLQFPAVFEGNNSKEPPPNKWMMWHASVGMKPAPAAQAAPGFPGTLSEIIARLIAKQPAERYGSAEELLSDLRVARHELTGPLESTPPPPPVKSAVPAAPIARPIAEKQATGIVESIAATPSPVPPPVPPAPPAPSTPGAGRYWVRLRGKVTGPFDLATLQKHVKQGQLSRLHQVSTDQATWKAAADIDGLYGTAVV